MCLQSYHYICSIGAQCAQCIYFWCDETVFISTEQFFQSYVMFCVRYFNLFHSLTRQARRVPTRGGGQQPAPATRTAGAGCVVCSIVVF